MTINHHLCCPKHASVVTSNHRWHRYRFVVIAVVMAVSVIFPISVVTRIDAFLVGNDEQIFARRRIATTQQQRQQQQQSRPPMTKIPRNYNPFTALSLSSEASETTGLDSAVAGNENHDGNSTLAANDVRTSLTIREERKRYDAELEEAFAQQTREKNPLLGVKSIGVDYGLVRTGVAVTIGYNPETLDVIVTDHPLLADYEAEKLSEEEIAKEEERRLEIQRSKVTERVVELAKRENAERIVVGLPLHKNGTEAPQSLLARKFACDHLALEVLRSLGPGVSVYMCDERYTSKEAAARMRTKSSQKNNDSLYGLLDAESAKIILEQYYDDHLQRQNNRKARTDSDSVDSDINPNYNGEVVTIQDPELIETLTLEFHERQRLERGRLVEERNEREARARWRKDAMEQERIRVEEKRKIDEENGISTSKKKKKKKRKRK
jgi:putative Holliday junction resolvase